MSDCVFCKVIQGELPSKKVWENDDMLAIRDVNPQSPVHVLILPKEHIESVANVKTSHKDLLGSMLLATRDIAVKLGISDAYQVKVYSGRGAGQTVFHLHIHLQGGWKEAQKH